MYWNRMLKLNFYFLHFILKSQSCEKSVKDKSSWKKPNLTNYAICLLLFCVIVKVFLRELPQLFNIRSACIVYLLNFGKRYSTFLNFWITCFGKSNNHVVALLMSFLRVLLFTLMSCYYFLHLGFCEAYQNCLIALIKITTVHWLGTPILIYYRTIADPNTWVEDSSRALGSILYLKAWRVFHLPHLGTLLLLRLLFFEVKWIVSVFFWVL